VCRKQIPASPEGKVAFVKHPFFSTEHMCVHHAEVPHRRCSGCQRFEPDDKPFIDLMDRNRCVCPACCRTVIFDSKGAQQLWKQVIYFFEFKLRLPVWEQMVDVPILIVGSDELERQMIQENSIHAHSTQIMTSGVGLSGFGNKPSVLQILCLSGLPRDLTLSILTREATLAWFKLHPKNNPRTPLPDQVAEGIAQLVAFLFLGEAMRTSEEVESSIMLSEDGDGPSDERLRQYFKFTIERDNHEIYGGGYRKAAVAYREVGIEKLLDHALTYRDFPQIPER
jgi:Protein DA1